MLWKPTQQFAHHVCLLPGGPGLSPMTVAELERLCLSNSVVRFWAPGTGNQYELQFSKATSHEDNFRFVIASALETLKANFHDASLSFIGHSFGGKIAIDMARELTCQTNAVVVIASPFTATLEQSLVDAVERLADDQFRKIRRQYYRDPTRETYQRFSSRYADWCSLQSDAREKIRQMLLNDESSSLATARWNKRQGCDSDLECDVQKLRCKKIGIFGSDDQLVDIGLAESECKRLGFQFFRIAGAGHFPFLENPVDVRNALEYALLASTPLA